MKYSSTEKCVLQALIKNADPETKRTRLLIGDVPHNISMNVYDILRKFESENLITNAIFGTGAYLEDGYLSQEAFEYDNDKNQYGAESPNYNLQPSIFANTVIMNNTFDQCTLNINETIEKEYNNDSELISLFNELIDNIKDVKSIEQLSKNKSLISKISDALKKHEKLVEPFTVMMAKALATILGIQL